MFHELFEVDVTVAVQVSGHGESDYLCFGQINLRAFCQALCVLCELESAIHISVILFECAEKLVHVKLLRHWMLDWLLFGDHFVNVLLLDHRIKVELRLDILCAYLGELLIWNHSIAVAV